MGLVIGFAYCLAVAADTALQCWTVVEYEFNRVIGAVRGR